MFGQEFVFHLLTQWREMRCFFPVANHVLELFFGVSQSVGPGLLAQDVPLPSGIPDSDDIADFILFVLREFSHSLTIIPGKFQKQRGVDTPAAVRNPRSGTVTLIFSDYFHPVHAEPPLVHFPYASPCKSQKLRTIHFDKIYWHFRHCIHLILEESGAP